MSSVRKISHSGVYHVMVRGINKEAIFQDKVLKKTVRYYIEKSLKRMTVKLFCYCIMSNHLHMLMKADSLEELSAFMSGWEVEYAKHYNAYKERNGYVFQGRYKSEVIDDELYLWTCFRYIHLNPIKAKCSDSLFTYEFSSAWEYANQKKILLSDEMMEHYNRKFNSIKEFTEFHKYETGNILFVDVPEDREEWENEIAEKILGEIVSRCQHQELAENNIYLKKRLCHELIKTKCFSKYRAEKVCDRIIAPGKM